MKRIIQNKFNISHTLGLKIYQINSLNSYSLRLSTNTNNVHQLPYIYFILFFKLINFIKNFNDKFVQYSITTSCKEREAMGWD